MRCATFSLIRQQCDVAAELVLLNDGRGPEVVIEAVGNQQTIEQATGLAAFSGRVVWRRLRQTASELSECAVP